MNSAMVKPIPASVAPAIRCDQRTPPGSTPSPVRSATAVPAVMPMALPTSRATATPMVTGDVAAVRSVSASSGDPGVGQPEHRDDDVGGPPVQHVQQPGARPARWRAAERAARRARSASGASRRARPYSRVRSTTSGSRRPGRQQQADQDAGQRRVHARGLHRQPQRDADQHVRGQPPDAGPPQAQRAPATRTRGDDERGQVQVVGVEERHHRDRADVVDDGQGQQEQPQPVGAARPEQRQDAEHERGVGGHDDAPAGARRARSGCTAR